MTEPTPAPGIRYSPRRSFFMNLFWVVIISLLALAIYYNIYKADFFLDDYLHLHLVKVIDNPLTPYFTNLFMGAFFRPGTFIFWKLNHAFSGLNASAYYATNMVFLVAMIALFFYVLHNITGNRKFSGLATLLFAANPVTGVGLLWLSNRFDLIGATFYLAALLAFLRYMRTKRRGAYWAALVLGTYSYFCKEMMITLPVIMILCTAFMFGYRATLTRAKFWEIVSASTPFFTIGVLFILWRYGIIHSLGGYSGETKVPITTLYIKQLYVAFSDHFWLMRLTYAFVVYLILWLLLLIKADFFKNNPLLLLGLAIATITSIPLVMVFQMAAVMSYMTPRFFFLPSLGVIIMLASVYDPRSGLFRKSLAVLFLLISFLIFSVNSFLMTYKWADDRHKNVKTMAKIHNYLQKQGTVVDPGRKFYMLQLDGVDVALDAGMKLRYPEYMDKAYFLNPNGPTQVIATEGLHQLTGRHFNWPQSFNLNPCTYGNLVYGVINTYPLDIIRKIGEDEKITILAPDGLLSLRTVDKEGVQGLLATWGVLDYE